jgi:riboflavin kinase / FMN adenylyltransferase
MRRFYSIESLAGEVHRPVVTVGNFDGVHRGHQAMMAKVIRLATARQVSSLALTFEPHPARFFRPELPPFRLMTLQQKEKGIAECSLDALLVLDFDTTLSSMTAEDFVDGVLCRDLDASAVVVGGDFTFGRGRLGDVSLLRSRCAEQGVEVIVFEPVEHAEETISSTGIRRRLLDADLAAVGRLLGRDFALTGHVVHGDARGREMGYPTANIETENELLPPDGIYASRLELADGTHLLTATYIGRRPTFSGRSRTVEAFVLDAQPDLDLYGQRVTLSFCSHIRGDRAFESVSELVEQIARDVSSTRAYFRRVES